MSLNELHRHMYLLFSRVASELNEKTSKVQKAKLEAMMTRTHKNYELGKKENKNEKNDNKNERLLILKCL